MHVHVHCTCCHVSTVWRRDKHIHITTAVSHALLQQVYRLAGPRLVHLVPKTGGGGGGGGLGGGGLGGRGGGFGLGLGGGGGHGGGAPVKKVLLLHCGCTHSLPFSTGKLLLQPKMSEPLLMDHEMPCVGEARLP